MPDKLKPCPVPWCNASDEHRPYLTHVHEIPTVVCPWCDVEAPLEQWNTRAEPDLQCRAADKVLRALWEEYDHSNDVTEDALNAQYALQKAMVAADELYKEKK